MGEGTAVDFEARPHRPHPVRRHVNGAGLVGDIGHHLERRPQATVPGEHKAMQPEVEKLLHVAGVEDGEVGIEEGDVTIIGQGGALAGGIIPRQRQHAAVLADAREVGVLEGVARAIHTRALAIPHAEHTVVFGAWQEPDHLTAEHCRRRQIFVHARAKVNVVLLEDLGEALQSQIQAAEWRATIARDERRRLQSGSLVGTVLVHRQSDERLDAAEVDLSLLEKVLIH